MSTHTLHLVVERHRRWAFAMTITKISKKRPRLSKPTEQAVVTLEINIPDNLFTAPVVQVEIKPEHIRQPAVVVTPQSQS